MESANMLYFLIVSYDILMKAKFSIHRQYVQPKTFLLALMAIAGVALSSSSGAASQSLHGHVPKVVPGLKAIGELPKAQRLNIEIGLPLRNQPALATLLRQLYDPASARYHQFLSPAQFNEQFAPAASDFEAVTAFAKASGLTVTHSHRNRTLLNVAGTVAEIEKTFHVTLRVYQHPTEPRTFFAPDTEPAVDLAVPVLSISGLDNYKLPHPMNLKSSVQAPLGRTRPLAGSGPSGTYLGNDFRAAYVPGVSLTGAGQTVGLLEFDGYYASDIVAYETLAGLPAVPLTTILLDLYNGAPGSADDEVSLDIEMAISMAPGLAGVVLYEAGPNGTGDDILNEMADPTQGEPLSLQLSASWTFPTDPDTELIFQRFAAQGQSYFNASGDSDAYPSGADVPTPAGDTNITIVGGTTLSTSGPGGSWQSETVWNWGFDSAVGYDVGSSGGVTSFPIPPWQQGINMSASLGSTTLRNIPDVALTADNVWVAYDNGGSGSFGGTSCATPLWAAFTALVNQQAAAFGRPPAGFMNPAIYAIAEGASYTNCFHDIVTGNNFNSASPSLYEAVPGYDLCTGWGTPNGANLINALAPTDWLIITPFNGFNSSGNPGGPFSVASQVITLTNAGTNSLSWTVNNTTSWLDLSTNGGTLEPAGDSSTLIVSLDASVTNFPPGVYSAALWFTNLADSVGQAHYFTLTVLGQPVITAQPQNVITGTGGLAIFTVDASGATPLAYFWQENGAAVPGATNPAYTAANVQLSNSGSHFSCIVTNVFGAVTSSIATLTVESNAFYFFSGPDGANPYCTLIQASDGNLYGTTADGANDYGTVFRLTTNHQLTTLVSFVGTNGAYPQGGVVQASDGNLYGTTSAGGGSNYGTIFQMTTNGSLATLVSFNGTNGISPLAPLVQACDGNLYGTTYLGGEYLDAFELDDDYGSVFRVTTSGVFTSLASFLSGEGVYPVAGLMQGSDGYLYGATAGGGMNRGTIFKMLTNGLPNFVVEFNGTDGEVPLATLAQDTDGTFYGTTSEGGPFGAGTVFRIDTNGELATLVSFDNTNGVNPEGVLVKGIDGNFYGATTQGGSYNYGTVFSVASDGTFATLFSFDGTNGCYPLGALTLANDGSFYGTTVFGGVGFEAGNVVSGAGVIYRVVLTPSPPVIVTQPVNQTVPAGYSATFAVSVTGDAVLKYFWLSNNIAIAGATNSTLTMTNVQLADSGAQFSCLITNYWGASNSSVATLTVNLGPPVILTQPVNQRVTAGQSATFSIAAIGGDPLDYLWLVNGVAIDGATNPVLTITNLQLSDSGAQYKCLVTNLWGATNSLSAVLTVVSNFPPTAVLMYSFGGPDGANPCAPLIQGADGGFYGTTENGGAFDNGTVFRMAPDGMLTNLVSFNDTNGANPVAGLIQDADGTLFGTAEYGGAYGRGTVFAMTTNGWMTNLISFNYTNGSGPASALIIGSDGTLYGTTEGGQLNDGTVFEMTTDGVWTNLIVFDVNNGLEVEAGVVQGADGNLYGTSVLGGRDNWGNIFRLSTNGVFTNLANFGYTNGTEPQTSLVEGSDGNFYGTASFGGTNYDGTVFQVTTNGALNALVLFDGTNGSHPFASLIQASDGNFYGTTSAGGVYGQGTIFKMTTNAVLTTVFSFSGTNGAAPQAALVQAADGNLYGTTTYGGATYNGPYTGDGVIFCYLLNPAVSRLAITGATVLPDNTVKLTTTATPNTVFRVLGSTDLQNWQTLATLTNFTGTLPFIDASATNYSARFYTVVSP
jgi:uncharacterized repeat protein (TIGR03803 family)